MNVNKKAFSNLADKNVKFNWKSNVAMPTEAKIPYAL
jgi:hypothetical protein